MEQIVSAKTNLHHYIADACVVWCFDDRFTGLLEKFIAAKGWEHVDLVKVAGGAKGLASPANNAEREYLLDQIAKSIKLHHPPLIVLMVHADCGAYGKKFDKPGDEENFYAGELEKSESAVRNFLLQNGAAAKVEKYFADFSGLVKI